MSTIVKPDAGASITANDRHVYHANAIREIRDFTQNVVKSHLVENGLEHEPSFWYLGTTGTNPKGGVKISQARCQLMPSKLTGASLVFTFSALLCSGPAVCQVAGTGNSLNHPYEAIEDSSGAIYVADAGNNRIITFSNGTLSIIAGGNAIGGYSGDNGPAVSASLNAPQDIVFDSQGNLYISDTNNNRIRKINTAGIIVTVAGVSAAGFSGDGGTAVNAAIHYPAGIASDSLGNVYFADLLNQRIREITPQGVISTVAGNGTAGYGGDGGLATNAALQNPEGVSVDQAGNLYIADNYNSRIRKVSASTGIITTVVGTGVGGYNGDGISATLANIYGPPRVTVVPNGDLYIADSGNQRVRRVDAQTQLISTVAGNGTAGYAGDGGPATQAEVNNSSQCLPRRGGPFAVCGVR